ncbi:dicarboxylate/amino acid:cation symporter (plasmid) [Burkholderia aenigmatica]|uniref:dicarboxylate/amino acid:cation symporter n=1 Tax=Burkholderia aenigmatica TaxID=2015348 RepID=UPI003B42B8E1
MKQRNKATSLSILMIVSLVLGLLAGVFYPVLGQKITFLATLFGHSIKMVVMPLILLSVTIGTYRAVAQKGHLGRTATVSIAFFVVMTVIASASGLLLNMIFHPGLGAAMSGAASLPPNLATEIDWVKFLTDLIPANIVAALGSGNTIAVLVFGVMLGAALGTIEESASPAIAVFESFLAGLFKMIEWIVATAPLAIFASVATLIGSKGIASLAPLIKLLGIAYLGMAALALLLTLIVKLAGYGPLAVIKKVSEPLILAFTTRSSEITFPVHLKKLTEMGVPQPVASTILPLSYIFNRDGAVLYTALVVGYLVDAYHLAWSWPLALTILVLTILTIDGAANVPSGAIVAITIVLTTIGLPAEAIVLVLGVDAFFDMGRTALNVYASTVATMVALKVSDGAALETEQKELAPLQQSSP